MSLPHRLWRELSNALVLSRIAVVFLVATGTVFGYKTGALPPIPDVNLPVLFGFARWDAGYYLGMAENGYAAFPQQQAYAFRPLFPLIMWLLGPLFVGLDTRPAEVAAGFAWNLFAVAMIAVFLSRLTKILLGPEVASRTLLLLAIFPSTIFLSAIYTEATNLLLIVISLYLLETDRVLWAGVVGFAAGMVRPETFLLAIPFFVRWLMERRKLRLLIASITTFLSLPAFAAFTYLETGNYLLEFEVQRTWPKCTLYCFLSNPLYQLSQDTLSFTVNLVSIALAVAFVAYPLLKGETSLKLFSYYVWAFILIAIVFYVGESRAWARLVLLMPPVFWSQAKFSIGHPTFFQGLVVTYAIMMCISTILFVNWYPML